MLGSDSTVPTITSQNNIFDAGYSVSCSAKMEHRNKADNCPRAAQLNVKIRIELQNVERPPEISVASQRCCTEGEDDASRQQIVRRASGVESRVTKISMTQMTQSEMTKTISCAYGTPPSPSRTTIVPKTIPPPRMRQSMERRSQVSVLMRRAAMRETTRENQGDQEHRLAVKTSRRRAPRVRRLQELPSENASRPITCTIPSSERT